MNTSVEGDRPVAEAEETASCCDATCGCNAQGLNNRAKIAICSLIGLAAIAVILVGSANRASTAPKTQSFASAAGSSSASTEKPSYSVTSQPGDASAAVAAPATDAPDKRPAAAPAKPAASDVWGPTLTSLAALNEEAANKDAVFVLVPANDGKQSGAVRAVIESAAKKARARGSDMMAYRLSSGASEYAEIAQLVELPCVLVMVKGAGAAPVSGDITESKLLQALVTASRPSSCGPSGCGPVGCN